MDMLEALDRGGACRSTACTQMNDQSSRSHAVFTIHLRQIKHPKVDKFSAQDSNNDNNNSNSNDNDNDNNNDNNNNDNNDASAAEPIVLQSKFHFVDLAGAVGTRLIEGISINSGLLALGNVISALGDPRLKCTHVPFRDSKITRLLQDSLGGNSCTLMVACISPAASNILESKSTLAYANRAKNIQNKPVVNRDSRSKEIFDLKARVKELEARLKKSNGPEDVQSWKSPMADQGFQAWVDQTDQINQLKSDLTDANNEVIRLQEKTKQLRLQLSEMAERLATAKADDEMQRQERARFFQRLHELVPSVDLDSLTLLPREEPKTLDTYIQANAKLQLENEQLKKELALKTQSESLCDRDLLHLLQDHVSKLVKGDLNGMNESIALLEKAKKKNHETMAIMEEEEDVEEVEEEEDDKTNEHFIATPEMDQSLIKEENEDDDSAEINEEWTEMEGEGEEDEDGEEGRREDSAMATEDNKDNNNNNNNNNNNDENANKNDSANHEKSTDLEPAAQLLKEERKLGIIFICADEVYNTQKRLLQQVKDTEKKKLDLETEQLTRERTQKLNHEKYSREIDKTNRDIEILQVFHHFYFFILFSCLIKVVFFLFQKKKKKNVLKQLVEQKRVDATKKEYYEKQIQDLNIELEDAYKKTRQLETEKSKLNPEDIKKFQASQVKLQEYENKIKLLTKQLLECKLSNSQSFFVCLFSFIEINIFFLKKKKGETTTMHKEDQVKINKMNQKLIQLKSKKVSLQKKMEEESHTYTMWKKQSEIVIKQLTKTTREKDIQVLMLVYTLRQARQYRVFCVCVCVCTALCCAIDTAAKEQITHY
ncbi:kinesin family member 21A [Reticulomyxa filosa]|uniref:Kinesin family member 21A n=1 Tax=Reticulomyxa filosa TaxID=46433 RepID=X6MIB0_RETFI|nr:kinesin family member 21A [Reticulomyxa filosa]|eukprot:ETO13177.1 kinesin family member 21A [Reticulomyxa filosa]